MKGKTKRRLTIVLPATLGTATGAGLMAAEMSRAGIGGEIPIVAWLVTVCAIALVTGSAGALFGFGASGFFPDPKENDPGPQTGH